MCGKRSKKLKITLPRSECGGGFFCVSMVVQFSSEKRRLLNFVLSNCSWENGEVVATFRQPFDLLAETTAIVARSNAGNSNDSPKNEIWLGRLDSNQGSRDQNPMP